MTLEELDRLAKERYHALDLKGALECYAQAFVEFPNLALAYNNYGNILREYGYPARAIRFLQTSIDLEPNDRVAPLNLALALLTMGDLRQGWNQFQARWKYRNHEHMLENNPKPMWGGEDIIGKTLLITCEEGDGDNIQFIRYVNALSEIGINVIIQTEPNLQSLFRASFKQTVITNKDVAPEHDYWIPILNLPLALDITYEKFMVINNYISPTPSMAKSWKKILGRKTKPRIAFGWRGHTKSYPREKILELVRKHPEYHWISLQTNLSQEDFNDLNDAGAVHYFEHITEWHDTAGLIANVDLVIGVDTGLIHLAGSMDANAVLLLDRYKTCWRWMLDREDSPWYPSIKIIRQKEINGFDEQLQRLEELLPKK